MSEEQRAKPDSGTSLKIAIAMTLLRSKLVQRLPPLRTDDCPSSLSNCESNSQKWKRKAKERKLEILRLKEDLKLAEDKTECDLYSQSASCKCFFFDNLGELSPSLFLNGSDQRFNDVLRRRFLRQVRLHERRRRRKESSNQQRYFYDCNSEDEIEQLRASVDFLVELCDAVSPEKVETNFAKWSHQAVDFILGALRNILQEGEKIELVEGIVSSLVLRLLKRMCTTSQGDEFHQLDTKAQLHVQHLIRKIGSDSYVGQRILVSASQRISVVAESVLFMDPFDDAFPNANDSIYMLIQLIEFLVLDYLLAWSSSEDFDTRMFEEWATSLLRAQKALELLESRNELYVLYMDRVIGHVAKQVGQSPSLQKLNLDILAKLFS